MIFTIFLTMPQGKKLSENKVGKILFYKADGKPEREIATLMKRSKNAIDSVIISKVSQGKIKRFGMRGRRN